jgi:hypothetical protein
VPIPTIMLTGPAPAARKALAKAGLTVKDIDLWEINEAFASVAMRFMKDMGIKDDIVNVNGGSIAMGHPLGATGCHDRADRAGRAGASRPQARPVHLVRRRWHGYRHHHRTRLSPTREFGELNMTQTAIRWEKDADNIVTLTLDDPTQSANTMNELYQKSMAETVARLQAEKAEHCKGVIVTSGKKTFFAGGDLKTLMQVTPAHADQLERS